MRTGEFILQILLFIVNSTALGFIVCFVCKKYVHIKNRIDKVCRYLDYISNRNEAIYLDLLFRMKEKLIEEERFEEIKNIDKCINEELKIMKEGGGHVL